MMGWRVGWLAAPKAIYAELMKVQDTIPICPSTMSQKVALGALAAGKDWLHGKVASLQRNHDLVRAAIVDALGSNAVRGGSGALYLMVKLPSTGPDGGTTMNDMDAVEFIARNHGVVVIPGSACGQPGWVRVCYANLEPESCELAARRLSGALKELVSGGPAP
eukprot:FR740545.1.p1 GENE.FR740545.1~~FR740545.1.p1  ORF type:complete len:171 (+),score=16.30 FR740545.1:25-513(+)